MDLVQDINDENESSAHIFIAMAVGILGIVLLMKIWLRKHEEPQEKTQQRVNTVGNTTKKQSHGDKPKEKTKQNQVKNNKRSKDQEKELKDPWLLTTLKGHTGVISDMDYSTNGKYLATCADDRTVLLWDVRDVAEKEKKSCQSFRVNLDGDSASLIRWSPDTKAFVVRWDNDSSCQVHRVEKKDGGGFTTTPRKFFAKMEGIIAISIAADGKFMITATNDNVLHLWDIKGPNEIDSMPTGLKYTSFATISLCGQFVAACGSDAVIWMTIRKDKDFKTLKKAFELKNVCHLAFDRNGNKIATISSAGEWKLYEIPKDTHPRPPVQITNGQYINIGSTPRIALSPQGETLVVGSKDTISFFKVHRPNEPGELHRTIIIGGIINNLLFDPLGKFLFVSGGDKHIKVFHNVTKYACELDIAQEKLKEAQTSATRERLTSLVEECRTRLNALSTL